jgi:hypothetical protein
MSKDRACAQWMQEYGVQRGAALRCLARVPPGKDIGPGLPPEVLLWNCLLDGEAYTRRNHSRLIWVFPHQPSESLLPPGADNRLRISLRPMVTSPNEMPKAIGTKMAVA